MTNLTNKSFFSLLRAARKVMVETAEAEAETVSQSLYNRMQELEYQKKCLDEINKIINNGSVSPKERLEAVREFICELYPDLDNEYYDYEGDEVDGQSQVTYGGVTPVDNRPDS